MGFGLPAAIGARVGSAREFDDKKPVWLIDGDGSFQMTSEELAAAFLDHAPVKIALLNNSVYGMVRQWQTLFYNHHYSATNLLDGENTSDIVDVPDFVKLAEAYGCVGMRAFTKDEAIECIKKANEINDRPVLIDFRVWKDAMVWPMVAAGDSNDNVTYMPVSSLCSAPARTSERVERKEGHFDHGKLSCIPAGFQASYAVRARREPSGRAGAYRRPVRPPRVQHQLAVRLPHRTSGHFPASPSRPTWRKCRSSRSSNSSTSCCMC